MILHYLNAAKRSLLRNKYYSLVNVFGLVFGMLSALVIAKYIGGSLLVDQFHDKKNGIYSITQSESGSSNLQQPGTITYRGIGGLMSQYPEVTDFARYSYHVGSLVMAEDEPGKHISFVENKIFSTDAGFLRIFSFPLRSGDPATALTEKNSIVISGSAARRYFGSTNPLGKTLAIRVPWGEETSYVITGVTDDVHRRTQFDFDFLISRGPENLSESWLVPDCSTFLLLSDDARPNDLLDKATLALKAVPELKSANRQVSVALAPLTDVRLTTAEYLLAAVGIFVIIISWVNYSNQVIAESYLRMKESALLRVMGASPVQLMKQFTAESGLVCALSLVLVGIAYVLLEPALQNFTHGHLLPLTGDPTLINFIFISVFIIGALLAAAVPAVILFSLDFRTTFQNKYGKIGGVRLRQALVVAQFSISTILLISVLVISRQLDYMTQEDKGIDMKDVLVVQAPIAKDTTWEVKRKSVRRFKELCAALPFVEQAASSTTVPGEEYRQETFLSLEDSGAKTMVHQNGVDDQFLDLYAVKFLAGQGFIRNAKAKNRASIILNESASRALGIVDFDRMIHSRIVDHESNEVYELIGIVKDYHQTSLKYPIRPIAYKYNEVRGHFSLRIDREKMQAAGGEAAIRSAWESVYPDASLDYFFLDTRYAAQDREDHNFGKLFSAFMVLSVVISCLGLFGLSLLISTKRQQEIGVRKVVGATTADVLIAFLKGYLRPLLIALTIGTPVAWLLMSRWLANFAYRVEIEFWLVCLAWISLALLFLLTVSYHTVKASLANPVVLLRE